MEKQVARLKKSGQRFILAWHAFGQEDARLNYSGDYEDWEEVHTALIYYLQQEIECIG